jgi:hypothetical protein
MDRQYGGGAAGGAVTSPSKLSSSDVVEQLRSCIENEVGRIYGIAQTLHQHFDRITGPVPHDNGAKVNPTPIAPSIEGAISELRRAVDELQQAMNRQDR